VVHQKAGRLRPSAENGKFAWILDPDGNKVELWEPMLWDDKNKQ